MAKLPPAATQQIDAANRITHSALNHAKIAVQVQLETTQAMLEDNMALTASLSECMQSGNMQSIAAALSQAAQQGVQRYMAQSQRLAELSRQAQSECVEAVVSQYAKSEEHQRELTSQFGMGNGTDNNMLDMMQSFLKVASSSAEQFGGAMQSATKNATEMMSGGFPRPEKPKAAGGRKR